MVLHSLANFGRHEVGDLVLERGNNSVVVVIVVPFVAAIAARLEILRENGEDGEFARVFPIENRGGELCSTSADRRPLQFRSRNS